MDLNERHRVRAGLDILPIGIINRTHEPNTFYEMKFRDPNGVIVDATHLGWRGAAKDVVAKKDEPADA